MSTFNCDLVVGKISVFHTQIEILDWDINEWGDELILNPFPDDSCHLVSVDINDWIGDFNLLDGVFHDISI